MPPKGGKTSHLCGLWMLMMLYVNAWEGQLEQLGETKSVLPLYTKAPSSSIAQCTQMPTLRGSATSYQNITSLEPRAQLPAHGMQELSHNISSVPLQKFTPSVCVVMGRDSQLLPLCQFVVVLVIKPRCLSLNLLDKNKSISGFFFFLSFFFFFLFFLPARAAWAHCRTPNRLSLHC